MSDLYDAGPELYCHSLHRIDRLGTNRRLIFTVPSVDDRGESQQVVVKVILPADAMVTLAYLAAGVTDRTAASLELLAIEPRNAN